MKLIKSLRDYNQAKLMKQPKNIFKFFFSLGCKPRFATTFFNRPKGLFLLFLLSPIPYPLSPVYAAITQTLNYQGFLVSKINNMPLDSPQDMKFVIYNVSSGGSALWTESRCNMPVLKGRYDVEIGSTTTGGIPASIFENNQQLWLEVQVDANGDCVEPYESMLPRIKLQASPYAFNSLYASTASAATSIFKADIIANLPSTTNGSITISTNLYVMGGISVGEMTPGQKLSIWGEVVSTGPGSGFRFPDGSIQYKAAAITMWDLSGGGNDLFSINPGNVGISTGIPQSRLHVVGLQNETGNVLIVDAGTFNAFRVTGEGHIYGSYFHGDGSNLVNTPGIDSTKVLKAGDTMTGQLTISASSLTIVNSDTILRHSLMVTTDTYRKVYHLVVSTTGAVGIGLTNPIYPLHVYGNPGTAGTLLAVSTGTSVLFEVKGTGEIIGQRFSGDGTGLTNITTSDPSRVLKAGDTMTGPLTLSGSTLTITGNAFSVDGNALFVQSQKAAVGTNNLTHRFNVNGGILAVSSITTQNDFYGTALYVTNASFTQGITASSATFTASGPLQYSVETTSGIKVNSGIINAPYFVGDGSRITNVVGTDITRVSKTGDTMTGPLTVFGSSLTIVNYQGNDLFSFAVTTAPNRGIYHLLVSTQGNVGIGISDPSAPLHVFNRILVTTPEIPGFTSASLSIQSNTEYSYLHWADNYDGNKGVLGYLTAPGQAYDLIYRVNASNIGNGTELLRIKQSGFVGIGTPSPTHRLTVSGGLLVTSSITASGGFVGNFSTLSVTGNAFSVGSSTFVVTAGRIGVGVTNPGSKMEIRETGAETYTLIVGTNINPVAVIYDVAVTTNGSVIIGIPEEGRDESVQLNVVEGLRIGAQWYPSGNSAFLKIFPYSGHGWIGWSEPGIVTTPKGALGFLGSSRDLTYRANTADISSGGEEVLRISSSYRVGIGNVASPNAKLHVSSANALGTDSILLVSSGTLAGQELFVVKGDGKTGIGTSGPNAKLEVSDTSGARIRAGGAVGSGFEFMDANTRIDIPAANEMAFWTNNSERLRIDSSGNVGIASSTPQGLFQIGAATLTVLTSGNVGIGLSTPTYKLEVSGNLRATGITRVGGSDNGAVQFEPSGSYSKVSFYQLRFYDWDTGQDMVTFNNGYVTMVNPNNDGMFTLTDSNGSCTHNPDAGSEAVTCSSDIRLKTNIREAGPVLNDLMKLKVRNYTIKATGDESTGVIAQEVKEVLPELVSQGKDGYLMVSQINHWKLVKSIQELKTENDALKTRIEALETKLNLR